MKKILIYSSSVFLSFCLICGLFVAPASAADEIKVQVDGTYLSMDVAPAAINGRVLVPLRAIFEALGAQVDYQNGVISSNKGDDIVVLYLGQKYMKVNDQTVSLDVAPAVINNRTLVPIRAISDAYSCTVNWDGGKKTVFISTNSKEDTPPVQVDGDYYANTNIPNYGKFSDSATLIKNGSLGYVSGSYYTYTDPLVSYANDYNYWQQKATSSLIWDYIFALIDEGYLINDHYGEINGLFTIELCDDETVVQINTNAYTCDRGEIPEITVQYTKWTGKTTFKNQRIPYYGITMAPNFDYYFNTEYSEYYKLSNPGCYAYTYDIDCTLEYDKALGEYVLSPAPKNGLTIGQFMLQNCFYFDYAQTDDDGSITLVYNTISGINQRIGVMIHPNVPGITIMSIWVSN
jgi:hypothetical protein